MRSKFVTNLLGLLTILVVVSACAKKQTTPVVQPAQRPNSTGWWLAQSYRLTPNGVDVSLSQERSYLMGLNDSFQLYDLSLSHQCNGTRLSFSTTGGALAVVGGYGCPSQNGTLQMYDANTMVTNDLMSNSSGSLARVTWKRVSYSMALAIYRNYVNLRRPAQSGAPLNSGGSSTTVTSTGLPAGASIVYSYTDMTDTDTYDYFIKFRPNYLYLSRIGSDHDLSSRYYATESYTHRMLFQSGYSHHATILTEAGAYCAIVSKGDMRVTPDNKVYRLWWAISGVGGTFRGESYDYISYSLVNPNYTTASGNPVLYCHGRDRLSEKVTESTIILNALRGYADIYRVRR